MIENTQTRYNLLCMRMRARAETVCGNFPRPLATEEHFRAAEERLGFHLPPILHQRYTTVSNGLDFFMPGYWFRGIADNWYASRPNWYTVEDEVWHGIRLDEATHNALEAHPGAFIVLDHPPEDALYLATLGGHEHVWLDGPTGQLWRISEYYDENNEFGGSRYNFWAHSVEDWLERKLAIPPGYGFTDPYNPRYLLAPKMLDETNSIEDASTDENQDHDNMAEPFRLRSPRAKRMWQHLLHLRRLREQVIQTLNELGNTWYMMVKEVGEEEAQELGNEEMLQNLANTDAKIYYMEWTITALGFLT